MRRESKMIYNAKLNLARLSKNPLSWILIVFLGLVFALAIHVIISEDKDLTKMRWAGQSLWNWLYLVLIPVLLSFIGLFVQQIEEARSEKEKEIERTRSEKEAELAQDLNRQEALKDYLDQIMLLLMRENTPEIEKNKAVRGVILARSLVLLKYLDGIQNGLLLRFLYNSNLMKSIQLHDLREIDLIEADLSDLDFSGLDLRKAKLHKALLVETNLQKANLIRADLSGANLKGADFSNATLIKADLRKIESSGFRFDESKLVEGSFREANLSGANLSNAHLQSFDLRHANLSGADLSGADLSGVNLSSADLRRADLKSVNLSGANLNNTDFRDAKNLKPDSFKDASSWETAIYDEGICEQIQSSEFNPVK